MVTKVMRYQIMKAENVNWEEFRKLLHQLSYEVRQIMNKTIQLCWEWQGFAADYKDKHGVYPKDKDILEKANADEGYSLEGYIYDRLRKQYPNHGSNNFSCATRRAVKRWKNDLKEVLRGDKSVASFSGNQPIYLHNRSLRNLRREGKNYYIDLSLISQDLQQELGIKQYTIQIRARDKAQRTILERLMSGEYKITESMLLYDSRKKKWFINLGYKFEPEKRELDKDNIMGIDMGLVHPVYIAFNHTPKRYFIEGSEVIEFRRRVESRRIQRLRQRKYCGDGSIGRGRHTRVKSTEKNARRIRNFQATTNHRYSRYIIDLAIRHGCGTIQMERLRDVRRDHLFLRNWVYFDLQTKIEYKAKEAGIQVKYIDPAFTSQRCSHCGNIHKENRIDQATFVCKVCNFKANADFNAARNIALKDIDKIIAKTIARELREAS